MIGRISRAVVTLAVASLASSCDRNVEPFVPGEEPDQPDLSKIFPEGARDAGPVVAELPPAPQSSGARRGAPPVAPASSESPIQGTVRLAQELEGSVAPGSVLFIIVRHGSAGPPLAVKRIPSPRFPVDFTLGPDDRMIETMPFAGPLQVSARVDGDGNVTSSPGDLVGEAVANVEPGARGVDLLLDRVL